MEDAVTKVISDFESNPMVCSRTLRNLFERDEKGFFVDVLPLLRRGDDSAGFQYLLTFLVTRGLLLKPLCDPRVFTLDEAMGLARRLSVVDNQFDVRLLRTLLQKNGSTAAKELEEITSSEAGLRMLDIMSEVSDGTKVLSTMTRLMSHPDPRVRSKAALLVGRSNKNHKWVQERLTETDARVRANAVESLWGADNAGSRAVYWSALGDEDSRVVANAVLALYRLGDPGSIRLIHQLATHPDVSFRVSGIWVMGETGDPRFLPPLARLISDSDLRGNAFRAIAKLKKFAEQRKGDEPLTVILGPPRRLENQWNQFYAAIQCDRGQQLPVLNPMNFAVWEDSSLVPDFNVRQRGGSEPLAVAFAFPRILDRGGPAKDIQEDCIERALRSKRKHDLWMVMKYLTGTDLAGPADDDLAAARMRFSTLNDAITEAISSPGQRLACACHMHQALRSMIEATAKQRAARNIILISQFPNDTLPEDLADPILDAITNGITVHVVTPWPSTSMNALCSRTGGTLLTPARPDQIPRMVERLCASLLHSYEVRYQPENPAATRLRLQVYTDTLMGEATQAL